MERNIEMSLLFHFDSPPNLLYGFRERTGNQQRLAPLGKSLANGTFLFDKFITSTDRLFFSLYELPPVPVALPGNRPRRLTIVADNFDNRSLFLGGDPDFGPGDFVETPIPVDGEDSPFPSLGSVLRWSSDTARARPFRLIDLKQDQVFSFSAKAVVVPEKGSPGDLVRTFRFDPEMVVGPDAELPPSRSNA